MSDHGGGGGGGSDAFGKAGSIVLKIVLIGVGIMFALNLLDEGVKYATDGKPPSVAKALGNTFRGDGSGSGYRPQGQGPQGFVGTIPQQGHGSIGAPTGNSCDRNNPQPYQRNGKWFICR